MKHDHICAIRRRCPAAYPMFRNGPGPVPISITASSTTAPWTSCTSRSLIWFEISRPPGQIQAHDLDRAVAAYGLEIAKIGVVEITVHVIYHELGLEPRPEMASITLKFFLIS